MAFRTPARAGGDGQTDYPYGLAASVWTENVDLALDHRPKVKGGNGLGETARIFFDAALGLRGILGRAGSAGDGRDRGAPGCTWSQHLWAPDDRGTGGGPPRMGRRSRSPLPRWRGSSPRRRSGDAPRERDGAGSIGPHRAKLYIWRGGRPPGEEYFGSGGVAPGGAVGGGSQGKPEGHPKRSGGRTGGATEVGGGTAHLRSQILYYLGENLEARGAVFVERIPGDDRGFPREDAAREVEAAVERCFTSVPGRTSGTAVHATPLPECHPGHARAPGGPGDHRAGGPSPPWVGGGDDFLAPAIAMGNAVVVVPWESLHPLRPPTCTQVLVSPRTFRGGLVNHRSPGRTAELAPGPWRPTDRRGRGSWYFRPTPGGDPVWSVLAAGKHEGVRGWLPGSRKTLAGTSPRRGRGSSFGAGPPR